MIAISSSAGIGITSALFTEKKVVRLFSLRPKRLRGNPTIDKIYFTFFKELSRKSGNFALTDRYDFSINGVVLNVLNNGRLLWVLDAV